MKRRSNRYLLWTFFCVATASVVANAQSDIDPDHKSAWGENIGWTNWRDANGGEDGVAVGTTYLSGFIWQENVGWINLGDGTPTDGVHYANENGSDFGVNIDPDTGILFGLAWSENVGWVNFDTSSLGDQQALIDCDDNRLRGFVWGENVGWINLDDSTHFVAGEVCPAPCGDADGDGDVDLTDFQSFSFCALGPDIPVPPICLDLDCDGDGDVDLLDFAAFQLSFTGG